MSEKLDKLLSFVPSAPNWCINWEQIEESNELKSIFQRMGETLQNPAWHGEGDVRTHTKMVCEVLVKLPEFQELQLLQRQQVFIATLLHDIGKIPCTRLEDGVWTSPNHTSVGARMARELLWETYGMCGTKELQTMREVICTLIRYHSVPPHVLDRSNPERKLVQVALEGELAQGFTIRLLCLLEKADMMGRIYDAIPESLEVIELCEAMAEEVGCLDGPIAFPSDYSRYAYLSGRNVAIGQDLYDDTWGEVILMSGLPGTGKDTYIQKYFPELPMISLDEIRKQLKISPTEPQGAIVMAAREQAKEYLRKKQSFVWDATSLSPTIRGKQIQLFENYGAKVRIIYLETQWQEMLRRNKNRKAVVPEHVIRNMLGDLVPPTLQEGHIVEWKCV